MTILIATGIYPPDTGGPATYVPAIARALCDAGHRVTVVTYSKRDLPRDEKPWRVVRVTRWMPRAFKIPWYTARLFAASRGADILFVQSPLSVGPQAWFIAKLRRIPLVLKVVGDVAWERGSTSSAVRASLNAFTAGAWRKAPPAVRLLSMIQRWVARRADYVIVPSRYLRSIVLQWGVAERRISVVPNGINIDHVERTASPADAKNGAVTIFSAGRLVPWKNIDGLLESFGDLLKESPDLPARLIILGDGPERARLEGLIRALRLQRQAAIAGDVTRDGVIQALKWADVFVLNSSYEGLSHLLLEACAAGTAIIATDAGGNAEVIEPNVNGILVPSGDRRDLTDALRRLINDENLRASLGKQARIRAESFQETTMINQTISLLSSAYGSR